MSDFIFSPNPFLQKVIKAIEENLSDENFGVTELAEQIHMSRSNLLRKIKQETRLSVSVFIRNVRLHHGKILLKEGTLTVSEISYKVGFNSTSYFTKCFREEYGYTPGEEGNQPLEEIAKTKEVEQSNRKGKIRIGLVVAGLIGIVSTVFIYFFFLKENSSQPQLSRSIAVLPFKNDSNDSSNVYIMNGLMEAILDNFQKIEDIKVTSRTTVEKYRGVAKTIPELSKELNVNYFIEGSGQKIGNEILLTIQLIEAPSDKHLWSKQYRREAKDIFQLQMEVAENIASEINAIITPEEKKRIEKIPTNNLVAYDYYLKGLALQKDQTGAGLLPSIDQFKKAILEDGEFANAYAYIAISYYYLDMFVAEKQYTEEIKRYADKAFLLDPELGESLIAQGIYFMQIKAYDQAIKSFEEVLIYYPNSGWVHNILSEIYNWYLPDTEKYLTHALQGIQMAVAGQDSLTASVTYLHLSNAFAQTGFIKEAEKYVKKSLDYNPNNLYSEYLYIYIKVAQHFDLNMAKASLLKTFQKDTTRLDVMQEIGKLYYTTGEYKEAWKYYDRFSRQKKAWDLDIYQTEDLKIGFVLEQLGRKEEAKEYYQRYKEYFEQDESIYNDLMMSGYYSAIGDIDKAMNYLKAASDGEGYIYWLILMIDKDPIMLKMSGHSDFNKTIKKINDKFWAKNKEIRKKLEEEGVL